MTELNKLLQQFQAIASSPRAQLDRYLAEGRKAIGCFPYYVPEELVYAADMVPFGVWGSNDLNIAAAKEYFPSFYCTIAQLNLEMGLTGALKGLSGVISSSMCDTLRPLTQNFRVAVPEIPLIFLAHPQNRRPDFGVRFTLAQYTGVKKKLEEIAGAPITDDKLREAISVYNKSRAARRAFVELAAAHPEAVSAVSRSAVLKAAWFMRKDEYTALLLKLNHALAKLPASDWDGPRVVTSGIILDNPKLLALFDENRLCICADDVAHESRAFRVDVPEHEDPMTALALQFAAQDHDPLLYDPELVKRPAYVVDLVRRSGAQGVVVMMMQFCDPEEMEYPSLRQALEAAGIPSVKIGMDQQMRDFGQAATSLQTFAELLRMKS
jgi:bcr-type benzoyl-CoA reductase subunit C